MTRWARANNHHKQKPAEATPWDQLKAKGAGGEKRDSGSSGSPAGAGKDPQKDHLRRTKPGGSAVKKPCRKKKEYVDEDVNGFLEYLQQTGQQLPKGGGEEDQELREEVETALRKDHRRENRRIKRQKDKKNNMVGTFTQHIGPIPNCSSLPSVTLNQVTLAAEGGQF